MGGERFETSLPECYLFGENADLNFLGSRPTSVSKVRGLRRSHCDHIDFCVFSFHIRRRRPPNPQRR